MRASRNHDSHPLVAKLYLLAAENWPVHWSLKKDKNSLNKPFTNNSYWKQYSAQILMHRHWVNRVAELIHKYVWDSTVKESKDDISVQIICNLNANYMLLFFLNGILNLYPRHLTHRIISLLFLINLCDESSHFGLGKMIKHWCIL